MQRIRLVVEISLNPYNEKWGFYFMSQRTGRKLHGFICMELTITKEVICRVEELGKEDGQPLMKNSPVFECIPGKIIMDKQEYEEDFNNPLNDL